MIRLSPHEPNYPDAYEVFYAMFQAGSVKSDWDFRETTTDVIQCLGLENLIEILELILPKYEGCVYRVCTADHILISGIFDPNDIEELKDFYKFLTR